MRRVQALVNTIETLFIFAMFASTAAAAQLLENSDALLITAEALQYELETQRIIAHGNVEISQSGRTLLADKIVYDERTKRVEAYGNITLLEPTGEAFFAEQLVLDEDLANGFVSGLGILLQDDSRIAARRASRINGEVSVFEDAVYSPCDICREQEGDPVWQIRADEVIHDQSARTITYRHARLEIMGIPIAYTPYFSQPDPTVERRSGLLAPGIGTDSELGLILEVPYYHVFSSSRDMTITPILTTKGGIVLDGKLRDLNKWGRTEIEASGTFTDAYERRRNDDSGKELRGHIDATGRYRVEDNVRTGFDVNLVSDNSYLQRYDFSNDDVLQNRAYVERLDGRNFIGLNGYGFQGLRESDEQGKIPIALPWITTNYVSGPWVAGSEFTFDSDVLALTRTSGLDTRRISIDGGWQIGKVGPIGDLWRARANIRGDIYYIDGQEMTFGKGNTSSESRLLPRITLDWRWPLIAEQASWQHLVEPLIVATSTVDDGNKEGIPNEDSIDFELDDTNLFEADRFTGLDRYDGGTKLSYGFSFESTNQSGLHIGGLAGQSVHLSGRNAFDNESYEGSGVDSQLSDYIGRFSVDTGDFLQLSYRFRVDHEDLIFRRNDVRVLFGPPRLKINLGYLNLSEEALLDAREELSAGIRIRLTEGLAAGFQSRIDLTEKKPVSHMAGVVYTDDCFVITAGLERRFTTRGEINDQTRFTLRVGLRTLGEIKSSSDVLEQ